MSIKSGDSILAAHIRQGIPDWNSNVTYAQYDLIRRAGTTDIFMSLQNDNINQALQG